MLLKLSAVSPWDPDERQVESEGISSGSCYAKIKSLLHYYAFIYDSSYASRVKKERQWSAQIFAHSSFSVK